jgi:hypothetical protein
VADFLRHKAPNCDLCIALSTSPHPRGLSDRQAVVLNPDPPVGKSLALGLVEAKLTLRIAR